MQKIAFVSPSDISGSSKGHNTATRDMITAFGRAETAETTLFCPSLPYNEKERLSEELAVESIHTFYRNAEGSALSRHIIPQTHLFFVLFKFLALNRDIDAIVTRQSPVMLVSPLLSALYSTEYALLARGRSHRNLRFSTVLKYIHELNVRRAAYVYTASYGILEEVESIATPETIVRFLPNAVDPALFPSTSMTDARAEIGENLTDTDFVIGYVGSFQPAHAVPELISAVKGIDNEEINLLLVGDGEQYETCTNLVDETIEDRVRFTGVVPHEQVYRYISACDILYGVTKSESATPLKCCEYLICGRPLLTSQIKDLAFVEEHEAGVTVPNVTPTTVRDGIREMYDRTDQERAEMGRRGREYVLENRTWDGHINQILTDLSAPA